MILKNTPDKMNSGPTDIFFILIIFQLLFLSLFLLTQKKGKRESNLLLGLFFLAICLNLLDYFLLRLGAYDLHPQLAGWGTCLPLLFGPFIYLYTQSVIYKNFQIHLKTAWHFLPFLLVFAGTEFYFLTYSRQEQQTIISGFRSHHFPVIISITSTLIFIQFLIYVTAALQLVSKYKLASGQYYSNHKSADVKWLYNTLVFFIVIIIISAINGLFVQTKWAEYYLYLLNLVILALLIYVIRILLKALQKPGFFTIMENEKPDPQITVPGRPNQPMRDNSEYGKMAETLRQHVEVNKPYLDPDLTLDQLATQLSLKPRVLSNVINDELGQSFYDFINRHRINEASRLLSNPKDKKITILEVLYEVGFNSKSSFNTLFKKYTGLTPTEFKNKNLH